MPYPFNIISCHPISCHALLYYTIPCHSIPYHRISYHRISYHVKLSHHTICMPYQFPYYTIPYHTIPYHIISYIIPYHTIPYHGPRHTIYYTMYHTVNHTTYHTVYHTTYHTKYHTMYHSNCIGLVNKPHMCILDSMAQSVICQPIIQSDGKLAGRPEFDCWLNKRQCLMYGIIWIISYFFLGVAELVRVLGNPTFESEDDEVIDTYYPWYFFQNQNWWSCHCSCI